MTGRCPFCGAPRQPTAACSFCRDGAAAFSLDELAGVARQDASSLTGSLPALAGRLELALPGQVRVRKAVLGQRVKALEVTVGDQLFMLEVAGDQVRTAIDHTVRGIRLSHDAPPPPVWLERLAAALQGHASQAVNVQPALERLLQRDSTGGAT